MSLAGILISEIASYGADIAEWEAAAVNTAEHVSYLTEEEKQIIAELNKVRSNPGAYAETYLGARHSGSPCYEKIRNTRQMPVLYPSQALSAAAKDHVNDTGKSGQQGSTGSDGSSWWQRIQRYGIWTGLAGESICYGQESAAEVIIRLLLTSKSCEEQIENLLNTGANFVGLATGPHTAYQKICVITFAADIKDQ